MTITDFFISDYFDRVLGCFVCFRCKERYPNEHDFLIHLHVHGILDYSAKVFVLRSVPNPEDSFASDSALKTSAPSSALSEPSVDLPKEDDFESFNLSSDLSLSSLSDDSFTDDTMSASEEESDPRVKENHSDVENKPHKSEFPEITNDKNSAKVCSGEIINEFLMDLEGANIKPEKNVFPAINRDKNFVEASCSSGEMKNESLMDLERAVVSNIKPEKSEFPEITNVKNIAKSLCSSGEMENESFIDLEGAFVNNIKQEKADFTEINKDKNIAKESISLAELENKSVKEKNVSDGNKAAVKSCDFVEINTSCTEVVISEKPVKNEKFNESVKCMVIGEVNSDSVKGDLLEKIRDESMTENDCAEEEKCKAQTKETVFCTELKKQSLEKTNSEESNVNSEQIPLIKDDKSKADQSNFSAMFPNNNNLERATLLDVKEANSLAENFIHTTLTENLTPIILDGKLTPTNLEDKVSHDPESNERETLVNELDFQKVVEINDFAHFAVPDVSNEIEIETALDDFDLNAIEETFMNESNNIENGNFCKEINSINFDEILVNVNLSSDGTNNVFDFDNTDCISMEIVDADVEKNYKNGADNREPVEDKTNFMQLHTETTGKERYCMEEDISTRQNHYGLLANSNESNCVNKLSVKKGMKEYSESIDVFLDDLLNTVVGFESNDRKRKRFDDNLCYNSKRQCIVADDDAGFEVQQNVLMKCLTENKFIFAL